MDPATMRQRFRDRVHNLSGDLTDAEVDVYLDNALQSEIPERVDGMLSDGEWSIDTVAGTTSYQMPSYVHTPRDTVYVDGDLVETFTSREQFRLRVDADTTNTGTTQYVLIYGGGDTSELTHTIEVFPVPADVYVLSGAARVYPTDSISDKTDVNTTLALAIISGAALEFALDNSEDEVAVREGSRFEAKLSQLRNRARGPAAKQRWRVTY